MTKIVSYIEKDQLTIILSDSVSVNILDLLILETIKIYGKNKNSFNNIVLDLSKIKYIDIEGALSIICFSSAIKRKNKNTSFHILHPSENILNYLMTIGFFRQMSNKVGVVEGQDLVRIEDELLQKRKLIEKMNISKPIIKPTILPITTIPQQMDSSSGRNFENMVGSFANQVIDTFITILSLPHFNFNGKDQHEFVLSNVELFKNIFEHSKSWGIGSIHARPNFGTTACFYDIGIGFKESVNKFNSEFESIEWALINGNTSKPDGDHDGFGLSIIQDFVKSRDGTLKIRSGDCLFEITSTSEQKFNVQNFPGVQISYFIPV